MVLNELGAKISRALAAVNDASVIDEAVLDACLKEICTALLQADVNVRLVSSLRNNVKQRANADKGAGINKRKVIEKAVVDELCGMLDSGLDDKKQELKKGKPNVVMFVGLQGSGKTTTCTKYAHFYKKKGFKPCMVCADTFRAGAFDQLKQNATKAQIPYYGSYTETDPAVVSKQGVDRFKEDKRDLIIVDTSGRHKQEEALFEEMRQVAAAVQPDLVIFVMDGSIGQAAHDQAKAFKDSVQVGSVIMTKMDGHAKGGGALSAVAATKSPIIFIGTGEHMDEFEKFEAKAFVGRLLGRGDWRGFVDKIQDVIPEDDAKEELMDSIQKGNFTMRILKEQLSNIQKMGPVSSMMAMIPGMSNSPLFGQGNEKQSQARIKKFMTMMDSMTDKELDSNNPKLLMEPSRMERIARGAGRSRMDVWELLEEYKRLRQLIVGNKGAGGLMKHMPKNTKGNMNPHNMQMNIAQMSRMLPPAVLKQMGGAGALQGLLKQMDGMK
ncbi:hypothetical protein WJX72_011358 [[Myrmecia] bisecta]|uniref:Signal recognition particle 54 kDa protein n=1 Tax=[Myrmecia] bisecta TaxID=41462 RepID=A0AAW1PBY2_9CHLO